MIAFSVETQHQISYNTVV